MPPDTDKVRLLVTNTAGGILDIDEFISYSFDSDLFQAADAFEIVVGGIKPDIKRGDLIQVFINDKLELTAIANNPPQRSYSRSEGSKTTIKGTDMMGLLTRHHIETGQTFNNKSTLEIVEELVRDVRFVNEKGFKIGAAAKTDDDKFVGPIRATNKYAINAISTKDVFTTKPGETVFSALSRFALSKGVLFFNLPDGTFVLGGLITTGTPSFFLNTANILSMTEKQDSGQAFSRVVIFAQQQNSQTSQTFAPMTGDDLFKKAHVIDPDWDLSWDLPFVGRSNQGGTQTDLAKQAALKLAEFKQNEVGLTYLTYDHSQGQGGARRNWQTNTVARVDDPEFSDLDGDYLVAGRRFMHDRKQAITTEVRLAKLRYSPTV